MSTAISRVNYFDKQFLRVNEFQDEQLYQLALRRRHNVTQHSWGIVAGLELADEEGAAVVYPGVAIDGYGRELLLEAKQSLSLDAFQDLATDRLDVWLIYDRADDGDSPDGYAECGAAAGESYRATEEPKILLERPLSNVVDARRPPGVPAETLDAPLPATSDDPQDTWRVYLGRMIQFEGKIIFDMNSRPYAGVVAETIDHPANATRVEIGKSSTTNAQRRVAGIAYSYEKGEQNNESRRFAVFVPEDLAGQPATDPVTLAPRLAIMADGTIRLRGSTVIQGNLRLVGGAVRFTDPAHFTADTVPQDPSMYRFKDTADELRIDLGAADSTARKFVIGFSDAEGVFTECLSIELQDPSDTAGIPVPLVTISGDLKVQGLITAGSVTQPVLSAEAQAAILGSFQAGVAAGNTSA